MTTLAGTAYVDILPDLKRFVPTLRTGLRAATAKDTTVRVNVDVDRDALADVGKRVTDLSGRVNKFTVSAGKSTIKTAAFAAGIGAAATSAARLGAALAPAAGALVALPALAGGAAAATQTLKLGLAGVSDTLAAGLAGDTEKYAEGLEKLAPAAQATARQVVALKPAFENLRKSVQEKLFTGVAGDLKLLSGIYLPALQARLPKIAASMSVFGENFTRAAANGPLIAGTNAVLDSTAMALARANDNVGPLTNALGNLMLIGAPVLEQVGAAFGDLSGQFADFINGAAASGALNDILVTGLETLKQFGALLGNVGSILGSVFSAANQAGGGLLNVLVGVTGQVAAFLNSAQGTQALGAVFGALAAAGKALGTALAAVLPAVAQAFVAMAPAVPPLAQALAGVVVAASPLIPILGQLAATLAAGLTRALVALTPHMTAVFGWMAANRDAVVGFGVAVLGIAAAVKAYQIGTVVAAAATKGWAVAQAALNLVMSLNPLGAVVLAITGLVAITVIAYKRSDTFRAVVQAAWRGIQQAASVAWNSFLKPVFTGLGVALQLAGRYFRAWWGVVNTVWGGVKTAFRVGWTLVQVYLGMWRVGIAAAGAVFSALAGRVRAGWAAIRPVFVALGNVISRDVAPKFRAGVDAVRAAWAKVQEAAAKPVRFVINTVINKGIVGTFNSIAKRFGVQGVSPVKVPGLAAGGRLPGRPSNRDNMLAHVATGEYIVNARQTSRNLPLLEAINSGAPGFADGGIVGGIKGFLSGAADALLDPVEFLRKVAARALGGMPGGGVFADLARAVPGKVLDAIASKLTGLFGRGGDGLGQPKGGSGGNYAGLVAFGRWLQSIGYTVSEHPAFGGVTMGAHARNSAHYRGAAIDVNAGAGTSVAEQRRLARIIGPAHASGFKTIFMAPGHYNHAHIAYDRGGMLQPGYTVAYNGTGRPEPVLTGDQFDRLTAAARRGDTIITVERTEDGRLARQIAAEQERRDLADRISGAY